MKFSFAWFHLPKWVGERVVTNNISTPTFWQRAAYLGNRQWYVLRRRNISTGLYRLSVEFSRKWGVAISVDLSRFRFECGVTGPVPSNAKYKGVPTNVSPQSFLHY